MALDLFPRLLILIVAVLHLGFMLLEMYYWKRPLGRKVFGLNREFAEQSAGLAANQGLYNGFLAAGLLWSLAGMEYAEPLQLFFLGCVIVAGSYGALTVKRTIFWIQAFPAILACIAVLAV